MGLQLSASFRRSLTKTVEDIFNLHSLTAGSGITAIKVTALAKPQLLLTISEAIIRTRKFFNDLFGGLGVSVITHHIKKEDLEQRIEDAKIDNSEDVRIFLNNIEADSDGIIHLFPWAGIVNEEHELDETFLIPDIVHHKMVRGFIHLFVPGNQNFLTVDFSSRLENVTKRAAL